MKKELTNMELVADCRAIAGRLNAGLASARQAKLDMCAELADKDAAIAALKAEVESLKGRLTSIGDLAHDTSTGPAVQDTYWEIRSMAYADV